MEGTGAQPHKQGARPSLRKSVTRSQIATVLVTVLFLVAASTSFVYRVEKESWATRLDEAAVGAANTVALFMEQTGRSLTLVGLVDRSYLQQHPAVLPRLLDELPALLEIVRVDAAGQVLANAYHDSSIMANPFTIPQSSWFTQAHQGRSYVGRVQTSAESRPYLIVARPAAGGGVVAARLRMDVLWEVVSKIRFGHSGQAYVVDDSGEIVAHPDPEVVLARTSIVARPELLSAFQAPDHRRVESYPNFAGTNVVGASAAIPDSDWTIFAEISRAEAFAATASALLILGGMLLIYGIGSTLYAGRMMQRLFFRPVELLREGAEQMGRGKLDEHIPVLREDEIGQVAVAFNDMAARLRDREAALELARDEALEASRLKGRLLANVSHDLRTPLSAILGYADMLEESVYGPLEARQQRVVHRILSNAKRLLSLINSLLDQAQIEAGTLKLRDEEFVPAALLAELQSVMGIVAETKGLRLALHAAPELPSRLMGDPQRLLQILENLIENAVKFTSTGSVSVNLFPCDGRHWALEVSDTGPGITAEAQGLIFEPFHRGDEASTREHNGLGLGLSIVSQLARLMGGEVHLDSKMGQGSTFTVFLPLRRREETVLPRPDGA